MQQSTAALDFPEGAIRMSQLARPSTEQTETIVSGGAAAAPIQTLEERVEEARRIRRMQLMIHMVMQVIQQDAGLRVEEASEMVADTRRAALAMFPDKQLAFDLIFWPRLQRLMRERYRMQ
jgi:hypothetical protein